MKCLRAVCIGLVIFCLCASALASDLDEDFAEAFEGFRVDPFEDFGPGFGDDGAALPGDGDLAPFSDFTEPVPADEDPLDPFGNAYMSFDSSAAEDAEDPFAEPGEASPAPETPKAPETKGSGSLKIAIGSEDLEMKFDASPAYSSIENHMLQAAFYTYGAASGSLYEMFLTFPESVKAGDIITPQYAMRNALGTSLVLLVSTAAKDTFYVASQQSTSGPYPETSGYTLRFDAVQDNGDGTSTFTGSFDADMVSFSQKTGEIDETQHIVGATFEFTMANQNPAKDEDDADKDDGFGSGDGFGDNGGADEANPFGGFSDLPSPEPQPTPTLEPDFRRV